MSTRQFAISLITLVLSFTATAQQIIGPEAGLNRAQAVAVNPVDGSIYVANLSGNSVFKITEDGVVSTIIKANGDGKGNKLKHPYDLAVNPTNGNVYVTGWASHNVFRITPDGTITEIIDYYGSNGIRRPYMLNPSSVAVNPANDYVYVAAFAEDNAFLITPDGSITEIIGGSGDGAGNILGGPNGIAVNSNTGDVYVTGGDTHNVFHVTPQGNVTEIMDVTGDGLGNPFYAGLEVAVNSTTGTVYATGLSSNNLFSITTTGEITELLDETGGGLQSLSGPHALVIHPDTGTAYVGGVNSDNVFAVELDGTISLLADPSTVNPFESITGLAVNPTTRQLYASAKDSDNVTAIYVGPKLYLTPKSTNLTESTSSLTLTVTLDPPADATVTVDYRALADSASKQDFSLAPGTLTFAPGETTKFIHTTITDDTDAEPEEDFRIFLNSPTNARVATGIATVTISDEDLDLDGLSDDWEYAAIGHLGSSPTDDDDDDGLTNQEECVYQTNPTEADTDGDSMGDGWEVTYLLDPLSSHDANLDPDRDGSTNAQEYASDTDPTRYLIQLRRGWNAISIAYQPDDNSTSILGPTVTRVFEFDGRRYATASNLFPLKGYLVYSNMPAAVDLTPTNSDTHFDDPDRDGSSNDQEGISNTNPSRYLLPLKRGWNFISIAFQPPNNSIKILGPNVTQVVQLNGRRYKKVRRLYPLQGYMVFSKQAAEVDLTP